ncbi:MAG: hypothetical protein SFW66_00945 [Gammaproteobacteria bacterium]|nr:hypothetical protein [Gammaproteobacteria bacterium]
MNKIFIILIGVFLFLTSPLAKAESHHVIRLAVFDNPRPDPSRNEITQQFKESYLSGINTAITAAAREGVFITDKEFFHENNLASIIQQASDTKSWKPDVIMGLSTSNDFLMSKAFFGDQIILSISATDYALTHLPSGFYSLGIPDTYAVDAIIKFIHQHYPNANLFITAAAESKESVDFANLLAKKYKSKYKNKNVIEKKFLTDDMEHLSFSKLMSGYHKDDIIVVMSIGYDSAVDLMNKISKYLSPIKPVFVTSTDNWGNNTAPRNMEGSYETFRIDTLSGGEDSKDYKIFLQNYQKIYHQSPKDKISFVTYQAVMSFVEALQQYSYTNKTENMKESLLHSYLKALKHNPNWYRPPYYVVYKLENKNETYYQKIN